MDTLKLKQIIEAALLASTQPLTMPQLENLFAVDADSDPVSHDEIASTLAALGEDCAERGIELVEVASGFRFQVRQNVHAWVARMWTERPSRYSRALLETLALVAYRQPITRGEIEQVRGVAVSSHITKTLEEREWIRVVGHRDTPGRPALFGTTRTFLDYFNLKSLDELPALADILNLEDMDPQLALDGKNAAAAKVGPPAASAPDASDGDDGNDTDSTPIAAEAEAPIAAQTPDTACDTDAETAIPADSVEADAEAEADTPTSLEATDTDHSVAADAPETTGQKNPEENRA